MHVLHVQTSDTHPAAVQTTLGTDGSRRRRDGSRYGSLPSVGTYSSSVQYWIVFTNYRIIFKTNGTVSTVFKLCLCEKI